MNRRIFIDMDGTLAKWKNVLNADELYEQGYYLNLEPNLKLIEEIKSLIWKGEDIYILSSFLDGSKYALDEKNKWLDKYLPELDNERRIFVKYGDNKSDYIKSGISNSDYLLDDYTKNLIDWKVAGGTGIKYLNGINHTKGTWKGLILDGNNDDYSLNRLLNNYYNEKDVFNKNYLELNRKLEQYYSEIGKEDFNVDEFQNLRNETILTREKLLSDYDIEIENIWQDKNSGDLAVHYKIRNRENKLLFDGFTSINQEENMQEDKIKNEILKSNFHNKIDIMNVSKFLKSFVDDVLSIDNDNYVRLYEDDLLDYFDLSLEELKDRLDNLKIELTNLEISDLVDIKYSNFNNRLEYIDVSPNIIYAFEFTNASHEKNIKRTLNYTINGKDITCELKYDNKMNGFAVIGYSVDDKEIGKNDLTKEELSKIQGLLLNEINKIYEEEFCNNSYEEKDITDEMY